MNTLTDTVRVLEHIAPLQLAAPWDNVGLLLQSQPDDSPVGKVCLTIDLTEAVLAEAIAEKADLIMAYHPIIFGGLKRITREQPQQRILLDAMAHGISIHSLHTALDAIPSGVNDWLINLLGPLSHVAAIEPSPREKWNGDETAGQGRTGSLEKTMTLDTAIAQLKAGTGLEHLRVAASPGHASGKPISTVAVCPGAGGSLFEQLGSIDLLVTGEMRHHDVLARVASGTSVILTEHTNCERGFLTQFSSTLESALGQEVTVVVSKADSDPLRIS